MIFDHFRRDAVDGAPRRGQKPHDLGAAGFGIQAPFQRVDLASQPAHPVEQFLLVGDGVGHLALPSGRRSIYAIEYHARVRAFMKRRTRRYPWPRKSIPPTAAAAAAM